MMLPFAPSFTLPLFCRALTLGRALSAPAVQGGAWPTNFLGPETAENADYKNV